MNSYKICFHFCSVCRPGLGVFEVCLFLLNLHDGQEHFACLCGGVLFPSISFVW